MSHLAADRVVALIATVLGSTALVYVRRGGERWGLPVRRGPALLLLTAFLPEHVAYAVRCAWAVPFLRRRGPGYGASSSTA